MSKRRKNVEIDLYTKYPTLSEEDSIVKVIRLAGGNTLEVENSEGASELVLIPAKFVRKVYVRVGNYIIMSSTASEDSIRKVRGVMKRALLKEDIKYLVEEGLWPSAFPQNKPKSSAPSSGVDGIVFVEQDTSSKEDEEEDQEEESSSESSTSMSFEAFGKVYPGETP